MSRTPANMSVSSDALARFLLERSQRRSTQYEGHSEHFDQYPPSEFLVPLDSYCDYLGNFFPADFGLAQAERHFCARIPEVNEEYFEFLDIFESAIDARGSYVFHEWGAGYARWGALAVAAVRRQGIEDIRLGLVEAEPRHVQFIAKTMDNINIPTGSYKLYQHALSGKEGTDLFVVGEPVARSDGNPWFGQSLNNMNEFVPTGRSYFGQAELRNPNGWRAIEVKVDIGSKVLADWDFIDLIDMDLQGTEADVVDECITDLNRKVRRMHIGTHAADLEARLRTTLSDNGWILIRDLPCHSDSMTTYGPVRCVDGVQSWFNPRFPPPDYLAGPKIG